MHGWNEQVIGNDVVMIHYLDVMMVTAVSLLFGLSCGTIHSVAFSGADHPVVNVVAGASLRLY